MPGTLVLHAVEKFQFILNKLIMKIEILREIIKKDASKDRFAVLTNITNGNSEIFELGKPLSKEFKIIFNNNIVDFRLESSKESQYKVSFLISK